jgi:hypothetical protein
MGIPDLERCLLDMGSKLVNFEYVTVYSLNAASICLLIYSRSLVFRDLSPKFHTYCKGLASS